MEDSTGFDACVMQQIFTAAQCLLPFLNQSANSLGNILHTCQTHEEANAAFRQFQLASHACKSPCTQFRTDLQYSLPQYLRARYLPDVRAYSNVPAFYLYLPSTVKMATTSHSYVFISYIAEVAGWYNLFLGGSFFTLWQFLCAYITLVIVKIDVKLNLLIRALTVLFLVVASGVLIYILVDCITILLNNPIATSTELRSALSGLSLSICWPQYTYNKTDQIYTDLAANGYFWTRGNNLSNKIAELSVKRSDGQWVMLWNRSLGSDISTLQPSLFEIVNIINSDIAVDFCHTVDLSALPFQISQVLIKAVDDITLVLHLAGQLLRSRTFYEIANRDTVAVSGDSSMYLYGSELSLHLEETSFQNVSSINCVRYNASWTYDDCLLDLSISKLGREKNPLKKLLRPRPGTSEDTGVKRTVLQSLYSVLLSKEMDDSCRPPCRTLKVAMMAEASTTPAMPKTGIALKSQSVAQPLPPLLVDVSLTIPELSRVNKERTGFMQTVFKCLTEL